MQPSENATGPLPRIIQGGMGIGVSSWRLANAVAKLGQLGVVSGTGIDLILTRRLQDGDPSGHMRRALSNFPFPHMATRVLETYFVPGGIDPARPYKSKSMVGLHPSREVAELLVIANFVEVFLAKEGHEGRVGINYLQKIQTPTLPSIYGAMLAEVDVIIIGAGIPRTIPGILDRLAEGSAAELKLETSGATAEFMMSFDPTDFVGGVAPKLNRPLFFPIVSSTLLAKTMVKKANGKVDGLIVEGQSAGGHNAPPRGQQMLDENGEPIYGVRDVVDLEVVAALAVPFWLAGSVGNPEGLNEALAQGAAGVQVGTPFAFCAESDLREDIKADVHRQAREGTLRVFTDPVASPTGFPFKTLQLAGTSSEASIYEGRKRVCDLGYLREAYALEDGKLGWRCSGEPLDTWVKKGGSLEEAAGRKCLCNSLTANIGLAQLRENETREPALVTSGDSVAEIARFEECYSAADVIRYLLGE
jgi:nitronate monooxygenase